ncbi:MAG: hypothetical protein QXI64_10635 [Sulfolobales archaeon]
MIKTLDRFLSEKEEIREAFRIARGGGSAVVVAPPGYGKTLQAARELASEARFLYIARTHNELDTFLEHYRRGGGGSVVRAYGMDEVCYKREPGDPTTFEKFCRIMRLSGKCDTAVTEQRIRAVYGAQFSGSQAIRERAREIGACLYPSLARLVETSPRVVATYKYAIHHPQIISRDRIRVFDEYHSIISMYEEAVRPISRERLSEVSRIVSSHARESADYELYRLAYGLKKERDLSALAEIASAIYEKIGGRAPEEIQILMRCRKICFEHGGSIYAVVGGYPFTDMDRSVYMSAVRLGLFRRAEVIEVGSKPLVRVEIMDRYTTEYSSRGDEMYRSIASEIQELVKRHSRVFIVYQSREVMKAVSPLLGDARGRIVLEDVAGGIYTEGVEPPPHDLMILVGAPYPSKSPEVEVLSRVLGVNGYREIARIRAIQAIGRAARAGARVIAMDRRFRDLLTGINWIDV